MTDIAENNFWKYQKRSLSKSLTIPGGKENQSFSLFLLLFLKEQESWKKKVTQKSEENFKINTLKKVVVPFL